MPYTQITLGILSNNGRIHNIINPFQFINRNQRLRRCSPFFWLHFNLMSLLVAELNRIEHLSSHSVCVRAEEQEFAVHINKRMRCGCQSHLCHAAFVWNFKMLRWITWQGLKWGRTISWFTAVIDCAIHYNYSYLGSI